MTNQINDVEMTEEQKVQRPVSSRKNIAVHAEAYEYIKTWAFNKELNMMDAVSAAVEQLKEESVKEIIKELNDMCFINEEHKYNFAKFLDERSYSEKYTKNRDLVAYYVNAIPSIATGNYSRLISLFGWVSQSTEKIDTSIPSEHFSTLSKEDKLIVCITIDLMGCSEEFSMGDAIGNLGPAHFPVVQEMIRLKMLGITKS